jgi:hypothetical protein
MKPEKLVSSIISGNLNIIIENCINFGYEVRTVVLDTFLLSEPFYLDTNLITLIGYKMNNII